MDLTVPKSNSDSRAPVNKMDNMQNEHAQSSRPLENPDTKDWQLMHDTMMTRLSFLLFNEVMSDVTFIVGSQHVRIPAHKFILSIGSTVFQAMFYSMLSTKTNEVEIPDIEPPAFRNLLKYLYIDQAEIEPDSVMTTLYTAKKYAVPALEGHCVEFLESSLNTENAFLLLTQARLFDVSRLVWLCLNMIDKHTQACLNAECFLDIDYETLEIVLRRDTLRVREIFLYEAVMRWSQAECKRKNLPITLENQRHVLKESIKLIRYPLMSSQEFAHGPAQDGLLTDKEMVHLFLYMNLNPKPVCEFQDKPRCCMTGSETVCNRFLQVEGRWGYSGASDRIRFQVDQRIFVSGFGLFGSIHGPAEYEVDIELVHTASNTIIALNKTKFISDGTRKPCKVLFKEPVEVLAHTNYCAVATMKGRDTYYGTKGLRKVTIACENEGQDVTFQFSYANGINNGTSVEDGQIPEIIFYP